MSCSLPILHGNYSQRKGRITTTGTFILAPGAWLGGWAWESVTRSLRNAGHDVYPVTFTGLGERVHLAGPEVSLETHVADVVNMLTYEDIRGAVLVGHSYSGIVVTGVSDRVPERIAQVVYVDTGPVPDGASIMDFTPKEAQLPIWREITEKGEGWRLPMPPWEELAGPNGDSLVGLDDDMRRRIRERAADQPFKTYTQPLKLQNAGGNRLPKVLITCTFPLEQVKQLIASGHPRFRELNSPEWQFLELPTGHWPMFSAPDQLAALLGRLTTR